MVLHPEPLFLEVGAGPLGRRFALHHAPQRQAPCGLVVYVHPFAEEMNKSRRMAAMQSRTMAQAGFAVLQMDLLGCGDSAGDFGDASWSQWVADVVHACAWLRQRHADASHGRGMLPLWLWGHRVGALLAVQAAQQMGGSCHFVFWQPASSGKLMLQQFLRLKVAGDLMSGKAKAALEQLRNELAAGRPVEVAGYRLQPALCQGLEQAVLRPSAAMQAGRVDWLEVSPMEDSGLSPVAIAQARQWAEAGWAVRQGQVRGPAFWQTVEIEDAPELLPATLAALTAPSAAAVPDTPVAAAEPVRA